MTERKHGGEAEPTRAKEFEQGDKVLGRCVVERCLRRDRLASFYSARALEPDDGGALCTVWSVHAGIVHRSERSSELFFDEMQSASAVSHPSIPAVIAFDPAAPGPVVLARAVQGVTLRDRLAEGELLDTREVGRIVSEVAAALAALHGATPPIFHRAVTPERVLTSDDLVHLEECGFAHALVASGMLSEREVESFAQPGYRVPSAVARGGGAAVDRFLLAILAFEALTGQLPFGAATKAELDGAISGPAPSARAARPTLPHDVDEVFQRVWSQRAPRPFASASEFAAELVRILSPREGDAFGQGADEGAQIFSRTSQTPERDSEVERALEYVADAGDGSEPSSARRIDVEKLLPMVSAALQVGERGSSVPPERRTGRALPPLSRALDLPPSKPTLLGASMGGAKGIAPFSVRPAVIPRQPDHEPPVDDPTPVVGYQHLSASSLREGRDSVVGGSESRPPDLTDDAELQERLSAASIAIEASEPERSVVELDESVLEPSNTNTNLQRIMDEIASFRPMEKPPLPHADGAAHLADALGEGITKAVNREDLVREELAEARVAERKGTPVPGTTLRPPGAALHGTISKKTPLPPLPPYESVSSRGTPLSSIKPASAPRASARPPGDVADPSGPRLGTPGQALGKSASLPTTTPPPTRLNTPVPLGNAPSRPVRRSVPPGAVQKAAASAPPLGEEPEAPKPEAVAIRRESDALAKVAPAVARLTALSALLATVGLIYAARQLDAYMSDPAYANREAVRPEPQPTSAVVDAGSVDDITSALAAEPFDATVPPDVGAADAALQDAATTDVIAVATADVAAASEAGAHALSPATAQDAGAPRRPPAPTGLPGDVVHARLWSQLSRRIADCVEGIDSHTSVTVFVRFDGATGMVQRIRSRGIFAEPPVGPCLEQAVTGVRIAPFAAPSWDTTFSFPIAPPRWRPPQ